MLSENKCLVCKHYLKSGLWEHRCKAHLNGIPDDVFNDNSNNKHCNSTEYSFEYRSGNPETFEKYNNSVNRS